MTNSDDFNIGSRAYLEYDFDVEQFYKDKGTMKSQILLSDS